MKTILHYGINDFIICCGYKGYVIKEYFSNYFMHMSDLTINMTDNSVKVHENNAEPWTVTLVNTGEQTMTGGRLKLVQEYVKGEEAFCFTYGDGLSDVNIAKLVKFHKNHGNLATVTATKPPGRFGGLKISDADCVEKFVEKPAGDDAWINGGFFVLSPQVIDYIDNLGITWEKEPLEKLSSENQLMAFKHHGFWQPMDTLREKNLLNVLYSGKAPGRFGN